MHVIEGCPGVAGIIGCLCCGVRCVGPLVGGWEMRLRMRGAVFSYIHRVGREGGGVTYPRMMLTFIVRMGVDLRLRWRARQRTVVIPP